MIQSPLRPDCRYIAWVGMETDLIFNKGIDLPEFASFPLLEQSATRDMIKHYTRSLIAVAAQYGFGVILESATWVANLDRAAPLGYDANQLARVNRDAVALLAEVRRNMQTADVLISANVGPRGDAYAPGAVMNARDAELYHSAQMLSLQHLELDLVSLYTFSHAEEAIGAVRAASQVGLPCVVAFTVETDGRLPSGQTLEAAIAQTDAETQAAPLYYMINCAHPDHFSDGLTRSERLGGIVVNASRCSHAELDEATKLDDGDPVELGRLVADLIANKPSLKVFGGCCGTDMRHIEVMAREVKARS